MTTDLNKRIGARVRHFRTSAGITQARLAELVKCEISTIGHCEVGKTRISLTLLEKIANSLNVDLYKFFIEREPQSNPKTIASINKMLESADKTQLGLIYDIISNVLDLTK